MNPEPIAAPPSVPWPSDWMREAAAEILVGRGRCPICKWQLADKMENGCVLGNCSERSELTRLERHRARVLWERAVEIIAAHLPPAQPSDWLREKQEYEASFNLRWKADMRAIKRWQEAHPGNENVWPDHADLCVWLMEEFDSNERDFHTIADELACQERTREAIVKRIRDLLADAAHLPAQNASFADHLPAPATPEPINAELLEALKEFVAIGNWEKMPNSEAEFDALIAKAETAIQKAEKARQ